MSTQSYCWYPNDGPSKGESAWSIIHKFCYRNATGIEGLIIHLNMLAGAARIPHTRRIDLRFNSSEIIQALHLATGWPTRDKMMTLEYLTQLDDMSHMQAISSNYLRFCPDCIQNGCHYAVNQLLFRKTCPIHIEVNLEDKCPRCGVRIPYTPPISFMKSYSCHYCSAPLWVRRDAKTVRSKTPTSTPGTIQLNYKIPISHSFFGIARTAYTSQFQYEYFFEHLELFLNYNEENSSPMVKEKFSICTFKIKQSPLIGSGNNEFDYACVYKSISRHIRKKHFHQRQSLKKECHEEAFHHAYSGWRLHWEHLTNLNHLNNPTYSARHDLNQAIRQSFFSKYTWAAFSKFPKEFRDNLAFIIFAMTCKSSFCLFYRECCSHFNISYENKTKEPPTFNVENDGSIFFTVESIDLTLIKVHFFVPKE